MAIDLYACSLSDWSSHSNAFVAGDKLPSPISLKRTDEQIWSQDTGRTVGSSAKMIGESITGKSTFTIQWGIISYNDMTALRTALRRGFFKFGYGQTLANANSNAITAYRSEITGEILSVGSTTYYKNASVSIIEQ